MPSRLDFWTASPAVSENGRPRLSCPRYMAFSTLNRSSIMATLLRSSRKDTSPRGLSGVMIISAATIPTAIGKARARKWTKRSCAPPGAASSRRLPRNSLASEVSMRRLMTMA